MQAIRSFVQEVVEAYNHKDKEAIRGLISTEEENERSAQLSEVLYDMTEASIRSTVATEFDKLDAPRALKDLISNYLLFTLTASIDTSTSTEIYERLSTCYGSFLGLYTAFDAQWLTPLLMDLSFTLIYWATWADTEKSNDKELKVSDAVAKHLSRAFNIVISDKTTNDLKDSKKMALYYLANLTFRVYFKASCVLLRGLFAGNLILASSNGLVYNTQTPLRLSLAHNR
ncbi:hypothetical protein BGW39_008442 [Mortierella sp. 14UC]|nr:hypothetical protein BGW39_008442 [Mortierella sp. 14UC]